MEPKKDDFNKNIYMFSSRGSCSQSKSDLGLQLLVFVITFRDCPTKIPPWFAGGFEFPLSKNEALSEYSQCILNYRLSLVVDYFKNLV